MTLSRSTAVALVGAVAVVIGVWVGFQVGLGSTGPQRYADYLPAPEPGVLADRQSWGVGLALLGAVLISGVLGHRFAGRDTGRGWGPVSAARVAALGVVLLVAGVGAWWFVPANEAAQFGWFAYAPLSGDSFTPPPLVVASAGQRWSLAVAALGAVLISVAVGYRIGRPDSFEPTPGRPAAG